MAAAPEPPQGPHVPPVDGIELDVENEDFRVRLRVSTTGIIAVGAVTGTLAFIFFNHEDVRPILIGAFSRTFARFGTVAGFMRGSLLVDIECFTLKHVVEVIEDYKCGNIKRRFLDELRKNGVKAENLTIVFEVKDSVEFLEERLRTFKETQMETDEPTTSNFEEKFLETLENIKRLNGAQEIFINQVLSEDLSEVKNDDEYGRTALHYAVLVRPSFRPRKWGITEYICNLVDDAGINVNAQDCDGRTALHLMCIPKEQIMPLQYQHYTNLRDVQRNNAICGFLFKNRASVDARDSEGRTPLHYAAMNDSELVSILTSQNASIYATDGNGKTPLDYALKHSNTTVIKLLLEKFSTKATELGNRLIMRDINDVDEDRRGILHHAVTVANAAAIDKLLDAGADLNALDSTGKSALHYAVEQGNVVAAEMLLKAGARVRGKDENGQTVLHLAMRHRDDKLIDLLLIHNPNLDELDSRGKSALYYAVEQSNFVATEKLLKAGGNVQGKDKYNRTVLHYAALHGDENLLDLLLKNNANLDEVDFKGKSALHYALENAIEKRDPRLAFKLAQAGFKAPLVKDEQGRTLLHNEVLKNHLSDVDILIKCNVDLNDIDKDGKTALHLAVESENIDAVKKMLDAGADVNIRSKNFHTPLHRAVMLRYDDIIQLLLTYKANPIVKDYIGRTALDYARNAHRSPDIIKKMEDAIASLSLDRRK